MEESKVCQVTVENERQPWYRRLSRWTRLLGVARCLLRWKYRGSANQGKLEKRSKEVLLHAIQQDCFPEEMRCLQLSKCIPRTSRLFQFKPFLDQAGIIRVGGRLSYSKLPEITKHPVILAEHPTVRALLEHLHLKSLHQGVDAVLALAREQYCIIGDRRLLRNIKRRCVTCRRYCATVADEVSTDLPTDRVVWERPFFMCGIDYAGPLFVKTDQGTSKVWIALFVCGTTRAVHLELVDSLTAADFILAWRRFTARRSRPQRVRSDNATVFVAAAKILHVEWIFNPPAAPWFGGFYERMVRSVKAPLRKVLGKALLWRVELETILAEIESSINNRPLTQVGALLDESPITPASLMGTDIWAPEGVSSKEVDSEITCSKLSKRMQYVKTVGEHLHRRWTKEYLVTLNKYRAGQSRPLRLGDVVFVVDDGKRQLWRLARVTNLYGGRGGKVRVAAVKMASGATMLRPVRRLVPLEVVDHNEECPTEFPNHSAPLESVQRQSTSASEVGHAPENVRRTRTRIITAPDRLQL